MSRFFRRESPPHLEDYREYRPFLRRDFHQTCAYCERTEKYLHGQEHFEIDHFRPVGQFPRQQSVYSNLYYSCAMCNRHKGRTWPSKGLDSRGFRFADPCQEDMYLHHFEQDHESILRPLTNCGHYTNQHIRLNRVDLVAWRREKRQIAEELSVLEAIVENLRRGLKVASERDVESDLRALESTMNRLRKEYSLSP